MADSKTLDKLLIDFLEYLEVERQVSGYTIRNYHHYLRRFIDWMKRRVKNPKAGDISLQVVTKYRLFLSRYVDEKGNPLSRTTQSYHVIALRSWFKWMALALRKRLASRQRLRLAADSCHIRPMTVCRSDPQRTRRRC